jgi:hypothetical protein
VTTRRIREGNKLVEVKDRSDGSQETNNHCQDVFQAFHFETSGQLT